MGRQRRRLKFAKRAARNVVTASRRIAGTSGPASERWRPRPGSIGREYDEWHALAEQAISDFAKQGLSAQAVDIDVEELVSWCRAQQQPVDQSARAEFASVKLREQEAASNKPSQPTRAAQPNGKREPPRFGPRR